MGGVTETSSLVQKFRGLIYMPHPSTLSPPFHHNPCISTCNFLSRGDTDREQILSTRLLILRKRNSAVRWWPRGTPVAH